MPSRKTKKRAHVSDSDYNSGDDAEDIEGVSVSFPQFSGEFKSWDAFHEELKRYQEETHQLYKIRSTNSVADRNKQRRAVALRRGTSPVIFDESLQFYTKTLICTHGWTFQPRGKGARTNHNIRSIDCPAKLNAVLIKEGNENYKVRVTKHVATHNHVVGQDVYYTYAEARKITSPGTQRVVRTMMQGGSKKKKILRYLKEVSGKVVLPKDVENLIAKMRNETYTSEDDNVRVTQVLQDFSEGPGNAVNVFRDKSTGLTTCITFQTAHMRRMVRKFPEAVCVDATYGTNINRYRLFSFMITDKFGCGTFAQHSLVDGESRLNMECAVRAFKQNNTEWKNVKVIIIDKDFTELALLRDEFPCATIILCHFHVSDYLQREVSKKDYGFSSFEKMHVKNTLTLMVRAENESLFDDYLSALRKLCASKPTFLDYFEENWLKCKELWCTFERENIPHLDNNTNNRLEASWGAAKDLLHRHMAMDECIDHLLFLQQSAEDVYNAKVKRVGFRYNQNYDDEMTALAKCATHYACNLVEEQYHVSGEVSYVVSSEGNTFTLSSSTASGAKYAVSLYENSCSCSFYQTVLLPCRHILYLRRQHSEFRSIIPCEAIPLRWLLADDGEDSSVPDTTQKFYIEDVEAPSRRVLGHNQKYRSGFAVCQRIAEVIADKGSRSFRVWLNHLEDLEKIARRNHVPPSYTDASIVGGLASLEDTGDNIGDGVTNSCDIGDNIGGGVTNSCGIGDDTGGGVTNSCDIGDDTGGGVTNSASVGDNTTNSGRVLASDSPMEIKIEKEGRSTQVSTAITRRRLNLYISDSDSSDEIVNIVLNTASKPAGRPREKASTKKAKRRKEFQDTKALIKQINTYGDTTLSTLREYVDQKKLSLEQIEPVFNAIRPRHDDAVFKRPKGHVVTPGTTKSVETNIRYVLPEQLVLKAQTAGRNAISRGQSEYGRTPPHEDITVSILDVGSFSLVDIDTMYEWHCLKKKIYAVRKLMKWIETKPQTDTRCEILKRVRKINVYTSLKSTSGETLVQFDDLTRFAGEMWLGDGCVFVAALKVAEPWSRTQNSGRITQVHVVDPVFLGFQDAADRARMLDTREQLLSTVCKSRVILIPVYIVVDISHWCGAIVDFGCKTIWIYDPKHNEEYLNTVTTIMTKKIVPVIGEACKLTIRRSSAWYQDDGHNCGVFIVKWFETYINVAHNTKVDEDLVQLTPEFNSAKDLDDCRYNMFESVFMDVTS